jgi:hypothetical protein
VTGAPAAGVRSALCVVSAVALVAGCSGGERAQPDGPPSNPGAESIIPTISVATPSPSRSPRIPGGLPDPRRVDQKDATAVSKAALTVMYTVDSTVDVGLRDAKLRAERYLTPGYTGKIKAEPRQYVPEEWRQHRAYLAVRLKPLVREEGAPSDGPTAAYRQWEMSATPTGRDGWHDTRSKSVVYMVLGRSSERAPWRISDVLLRDE